MFYIVIGAVAGGRAGYVLFYDFVRFLSEPWILFRIWEGGMSFHGGLVGVILAVTLFARRHRFRFSGVADFLAPLVPPGLGAGRIGNFINGELWGKPASVPWAMAFPGAGPDPRHPSQLYEALLEGLALFVLLWWFSRLPRPAMSVSGLFLVGYAVARGLVELVREPDAHIGYLAFGWLTTGQLLCVPMLLAGAAMMWWGFRSARAAVS